MFYSVVKIIIVFLLLTSVVYASDFDVAIDANDAETIISVAPGLATIKQLFSDRVNGLIDGDFSGFSTIINGSTYDMDGIDPPYIDFGDMYFIGPVSLDMNNIPSDFWYYLHAVMMVSYLFTAFYLSVRV